MNRSALLFSILIILGLSLILSRTHPRNDSSVTIGAILCLSGECSEWGVNSKNGILLAQEEINAQGGILGKNLEVIFQDSKESQSPVQALDAYRQLKSTRNTSLFIGPTWGPAGLLLIPVLRASDDIMTSPSLGLADFNEASDNLFNVWPHDEIGTRTLARYAREQGYTRIAVFSSQQPWEQAQGAIFAEEIERVGGSITRQVEPMPTQNDLKPEAMSIVRSKPELVFVSTISRMSLAARELRRLGFDGPIYAVILDRTRLRDAQGALENAITVVYPESTASFQTRFKERFGENPGISADTAYDTLMLYAKAIEQAGSLDPLRVREALSSISLHGASGEISFDTKGAISRIPILRQAFGLTLQPLAGNAREKHDLSDSL
ncbi:MAG: ABC transporter substrate-binding protein [Bdellovibrionales bacterium]|nr:ABC transporter substrate-binding protein [Bdellovibrionales bacterium]